MIELLRFLANSTLSTMLDVAPIVAILVLFQVVVLRRKLANLRRIAAGAVLVLLGLTLFLIGLENALFPIGKIMADQLTAPETMGQRVLPTVQTGRTIASLRIRRRHRLRNNGGRAFACRGGIEGPRSIGRSRTRLGSEDRCGRRRRRGGGPRLLPDRHRYASPSVHHCGLCRRDGSDVPIQQDHRAAGLRQRRRHYINVTVPVVAALGLGLATSVPGRSALIDGFGLIAFASVFPIISVLGYSIMASWWSRRRNGNPTEEA